MLSIKKYDHRMAQSQRAGVGRDSTPLGLVSAQYRRFSFTIYKATSVVFGRTPSDFVPGDPHQRFLYSHERRQARLIANQAMFK